MSFVARFGQEYASQPEAEIVLVSMSPDRKEAIPLTFCAVKTPPSPSGERYLRRHHSVAPMKSNGVPSAKISNNFAGIQAKSNAVGCGFTGFITTVTDAPGSRKTLFSRHITVLNNPVRQTILRCFLCDVGLMSTIIVEIPPCRMSF